MRAAAALALLLASTASATPREEDLRIRSARLPDIKPELVDDAVTAALGVETPEVSAELLLSLAWHESRFDPTIRHGRVCGPLQVVPEEVGERDHADACHRWSQDTWQGFEAGALELRMWLAHSHGDLYVALRGRACGWVGLKSECGKAWWIRSVLRMSKRIGGSR